MRLWGDGKHKSKYKLDKSNLPAHIAIIMDGNGRWARKRGMPRAIGHKRGVDRLKEITVFCHDIGIKYLTVYAFSTENKARPQQEVDLLMAMLLAYLKDAEKHLDGRNIRIQAIGDIEWLSSEVRRELDRVLDVTQKNSGMVLNIALNYGGRDEIVHAAKQIAQDICAKKYSIDDIDSDKISRALYTKSIPDPDLLIRAGAEKRISNFLLWQLAYTELWFTDVFWPDFSDEHIVSAINDYQKRNRRYGGINI